MTISIIIPIYNAQDYLERCLQSVLHQTHSDFELLLVDDGSKDQSGSICDHAAAADSRIQVLHQENAGQSVARNRALERCTGQYVFFMDSDDELPPDALEQLLRPIQESPWDVVAGLFTRVTGAQEHTISYGPIDGPVSRSSGDSSRYHRIKTESVFGYVWGKLYRTQFLRQHDLWFDDVRKLLMEDALFNLKVWAFQPSYYLISAPVYRYYIYGGSCSNRCTPNISDKAIHLLETYLAFLRRQNCLERERDLLIPLIARVFCWTMIHPAPDPAQQKQCIRQRLDDFLQQEDLIRVLNEPETYTQLWRLPSLPQRVFYSICIRCLAKGRRGLLYGIFAGLRPLLNRYAARMRNQ